MPDDPVAPPIELTGEAAEAMLAGWLGEQVRCEGVMPLTGGCISSVVEIRFDHEASPVVAKLSATPGDPGLRRQANVLDYFAAHTRFPVPGLLHADVSCRHVPHAYILMERVPGMHLGHAELSAEERRELQREMGRHVAALHLHQGAAFGDLIGDDTRETWSQWQQEALLDVYHEIEGRGRLSPRVMGRIARVVEDLPGLMDAPLPPVLNHGDIWSANIMVDGGRLTGFVDPGGLFAPAELDLAYLDTWHTADEDFYAAYREVHPPAEGYERRRSVYRLHTLMIHVWLFGTEEYVRATEELVAGLW